VLGSNGWPGSHPRWCEDRIGTDPPQGSQPLKTGGVSHALALGLGMAGVPSLRQVTSPRQRLRCQVTSPSQSLGEGGVGRGGTGACARLRSGRGCRQTGCTYGRVHVCLAATNGCNLIRRRREGSHRRLRSASVWPGLQADSRMRTYVYTYLSISYLHICMYIYVCMYICMHVCMYVCMYVCIYIYPHV